MSRRNRALLRAIAPLVLMGVIFYFSAQSSTGEHPWWDVLFRKLGHVTGYAMLTALWWWALRPVSRRALPIAVCIAFAYACTDELHQTFVHGRTGTPVDVGIDSIGMAISALLVARLPRARKREAAKTESGQDAGRPTKRAHLERA